MFEAETILAEWRPDLTVIDMDHEDSTALLKRLEPRMATLDGSHRSWASRTGAT